MLCQLMVDNHQRFCMQVLAAADYGNHIHVTICRSSLPVFVVNARSLHHSKKQCKGIMFQKLVIKEI